MDCCSMLTLEKTSSIWVPFLGGCANLQFFSIFFGCFKGQVEHSKKHGLSFKNGDNSE